ncbi:MAG TPA: hypothetical protein P5299_02655 [Candidatus Woesebacteria bacterium]|nr:hypothetical protein [Candidatus Woesebacteria bacterium]
MKKLSLLALIFLLASFLSLAFLKTGVYGQASEGPNPPSGGGGGGGGGVYPTRPIDNPIVNPTGEPEPDDPGPGNKWMYHCKYHECTPEDWPWSYICSPAAEGVPVGSCWKEIVPGSTDIREQCRYYPGNWDSYNCFESSNLCEEFCKPWREATPIVNPTGEPEPDDPGPGNKWMYHCKYHECTPEDWPWSYICSPAAEGVPVGSCWKEIVPGSTDIREQCRYYPGNWDSYNCFESSNLCEEFCKPWREATPTPGETEVVYCKPGCRTCEICRKPNGSLCDMWYCRDLFFALERYGFGGSRKWCEDWYCPSRCGYIDLACINACVPRCMTEFALDDPENVYDLWRSTYTCLPMQKGKTMCSYMCDPKDLGPAPGCGGYEGPEPTPTGVEPPPVNYWFCAGADGCEAGYDFYPSRCLVDCGEHVCRIDEECMRTRLFPGSGEGKANCIANCHCDNPCACAAETCRDEICVDDCGTLCLGENDCGLSLIEPPKIEVGNGGMNPVNIAIDGRVHICDSQFWLDPVHQPNGAYFKVKISHAGGVDKIDAVGLGFNHREGEETVDDLWISLIDLVNGKPGIPVVYGPAAPDINVIPVVIDRRELNLKEVTFVVIFHNNFPKNLNFVWASAMDDVGRTLPWTYTDTSFKYWDCQLNFSGKLYDDSESADREVCATNGYKTPVREANFTSLSLVNVQDAGDTVAAVISADGCDFQAGGSKLIWGKTYNSVFNDDLDGDITSLYARTIDLGVTGGGVTTCFNGSQIDTTQGNDPNMPKFLADPYVDSPEIQLDYSFLQNAEPWYQVVGGGIKALGSVNNYLRSSRRMVEDSVSGQQDSGWIAAGGQFSAGNSEDYSQSGWKGERMTGFFGQKVGYNYFYNELKTKKNLGEVKSNWGEIKDTPGILFIDGNLAIDSDSSALTAGQYRIVIVKGRITVDPVVKNLAGIFIADGNITISGESNTQLVIKGMIYSGGNITLDRGFTNHRENSTRPATVVQFDPNLIFNLPPTVYQVMSGWKQGI